MTIQVNVLMGGPSAEHEVSLNSGLQVMTHLDTNRYQVRAVVVSAAKELYYCDIGQQIPTYDDLSAPERSVRFSGPFLPHVSEEVWKGCDAAFLALHGSFGEDGTVQGYLDTLSIPYTGSGVYASALAMNKITSKYLYLQNGLSVPPYSVLSKVHDISAEALCKTHGMPCFVKCPQSGSSRLMGRADSLESLQALLSELKNHSREILIESTIQGIEFSCGVLEQADGSLKSLPPIEIRPKSIFFDYTAKYTTGASEEIVPAPHPEPLLKRIQQVAVIAHEILGCSGVSRTDMIYKDDILYVLETNTLPGLTPNSLLPKAFIAAGGTYSGLLDVLIGSALRKKATGE